MFIRLLPRLKFLKPVVTWQVSHFVILRRCGSGQVAHYTASSCGNLGSTARTCVRPFCRTAGSSEDAGDDENISPDDIVDFRAIVAELEEAETPDAPLIKKYSFTVAIIGRPNVGKSTIFNCLVRENKAIVNEKAGTTRDRLCGASIWQNKEFFIVDTGGLVGESKKKAEWDEFVPLIRQQVLVAVDEADLIVFVVSTRDGLTEEDEQVARLLRSKRTKHQQLLLVANKTDEEFHKERCEVFTRLGCGPPIPVAAARGIGILSLVDSIVDCIPESSVIEAPQQSTEGSVPELHFRMAIIGRPNAGKSTLLNHLLREERFMVSDIKGTTIDSVDEVLDWKGKKVTLVDTAGIRRRGNHEKGIERSSVLWAWKAIEACDVAVLTIDGSVGVEAQDLRVAGYALSSWKSLIIAVTKSDVFPKSVRKKNFNEFENYIRLKFKAAPHIPILFISSFTNFRTHELMDVAVEIATKRRSYVTTNKLMKVFKTALAEHSPFSNKRRQLKLKYATQVKASYPSFVFFVNNLELVHWSVERWFENTIRSSFGFEGSPIRCTFKTYAKKK